MAKKRHKSDHCLFQAVKPDFLSLQYYSLLQKHQQWWWISFWPIMAEKRRVILDARVFCSNFSMLVLSMGKKVKSSKPDHSQWRDSWGTPVGNHLFHNTVDSLLHLSQVLKKNRGTPVNLVLNGFWHGSSHGGPQWRRKLLLETFFWLQIITKWCTNTNSTISSSSSVKISKEFFGFHFCGFGDLSCTAPFPSWETHILAKPNWKNPQ